MRIAIIISRQKAIIISRIFRENCVTDEDACVWIVYVRACFARMDYYNEKTTILQVRRVHM